MFDPKIKADKKKIDTKEFELPETVFIRDIENKVFQSIVLQCLSEVPGISLVEGNFIDHLLGRSAEGVKGIYADQDDKNQSVNIKVEVNISYGIEIPEKAEEIQSKIAEQITQITGLHVSSVHVVFKNVISVERAHKLNQPQTPSPLLAAKSGEEYTDEF
ncbi:MAG: Asp23/Gls24 family envelope stress response protein [Parachlamydiaceae bacterium]|nr:Asp23/Gls24 family envelope stress response protein [Parachlamydiaceae bacterium]